jgi:hypothetical protein
MAECQRRRERRSARKGGNMNLEVIVNRLLRLARLDTSVFDEVRMDPTATTSSFIVAAAAAFAAGLGGWLWWVQKAEFDEGRVFLHSVVVGSLFAIGLWIVWLFVAYVLLTQVFRERADLQQLIRTMGMAAAPLGLSLLLLIPGINFGFGLASIALFFGLSNIAIQSVTTAEPAKVLTANAAGFAVWAVVLTLLVDGRTYLAPGIFITSAF